MGHLQSCIQAFASRTVYVSIISTYIIFSQLYIIFTANKYYRLFHYNLAIHACLGFRLIFATKYFSRKNFDYIFDVDLSLLECIYSFEYPHPLVSQSEIVPTTVQIYYQAINIVRKYNFSVSNFSLHFIIYFRQRRWLWWCFRLLEMINDRYIDICGRLRVLGLTVVTNVLCIRISHKTNCILVIHMSTIRLINASSEFLYLVHLLHAHASFVSRHQNRSSVSCR